ncbi:gastric inhibitory polypeptide [Thunnus albacares]|uniref:gastric inhibitory polypeptide n=1 Tax=Thunnus albacares TaxID=8236 RepID=UPI001CF684B7|nr:gastric inhibitory polypeptide [Thunnus albacares]XP_044194609.1 gastric inhibitory polypeptide [Thunnus albacares]
MKVVLFELLVICLLGALHARAKTEPEKMGLDEEEQHLARRYAESTIASEMSKIMDSMVQKNFVDFLLNQKQKKSKPAAVEEDAEERQYNNLLKLSLHERQRRNI